MDAMITSYREYNDNYRQELIDMGCTIRGMHYSDLCMCFVVSVAGDKLDKIRTTEWVARVDVITFNFLYVNN